MNGNKSLELLTRAMSKKIYHCNDAHQELARMDLSARRILYICLSELERERDVDTGATTIKFNPEQVFTITAKDYAKLCNIDTSEAYKQLQNGVYDIRTYGMEIKESVLHPELKGRPKDGMIVFTVANYSYYSNGDGFIEVKLSPEFAPYISDLTKEFTSQFLLSAVRLPKGNAYSLYLLLSRWISAGKIGYCEIELDELKAELGALGDTYTVFDRFRQQFFNRAVKQVIEITEFTSVNMEIIQKRGRKAHKVKISYVRSPKKLDKGSGVGLEVRSTKAAKKPHTNSKLSPSERFREKLRKEGKTPTF
ncbi:RepB family plasmid replication initiator protein [Vibrio cyclitrophicus 1F175]|nr:RepB family plasmid replication initiator protein [Vibrio cyclitrophicus 1F175]